MTHSNFWNENCSFGNSKSMFDNNGEIIKNQINWKDYKILNKNSKKNNNCKYFHKYFFIC